MDILNKSDRTNYIDEINSNENRFRRQEHFKRREVYNGRVASFLYDKLIEEFTQKTISEMRQITSINLCKKIVDELASIYRKEPNRNWTELREGQDEEITRAYADFAVNREFKRANRLFELHGQCTIKVVPKNGMLCPKALSPHQYDVIPDDDDPTEAKGYVISALDRSIFYRDVLVPSREQNVGNSFNEKIADVDDYAGQKDKYVFWTKDYHFMCDRSGEIIDDVMENPIGMLPFIEIASDRDFEFWSRAGSDITEFQLEFLKVLSDHFNVLKLQGYSQAVITSEEAPEFFTVGPNHVLHLKQRPDATQTPRFEFVTPSPDMSASLESLELMIRTFLSSRGLNSGTIASRQSGESFSSGLERLLAMLEKFEASADSIDQFKLVEGDYYELFKKWQMASSNNDLLKDEYKVGNISEESEVEIRYHEPEMIQTQKEREDSAIRLLDQGLMSRKQAIAAIYDVTEKKAEEIMADIDEDDFGGTPNGNQPQINTPESIAGDQFEEAIGGESPTE